MRKGHVCKKKREEERRFKKMDARVTRGELSLLSLRAIDDALTLPPLVLADDSTAVDGDDDGDGAAAAADISGTITIGVA